MNMKFNKDDLRDLVDGDFDGFKKMKQRIVEKGRWSILSEMVFSYEGRYYITTYRTGATECQEEAPYENEPEEIECEEVFAKEKTVIVYERS